MRVNSFQGDPRIILGHSGSRLQFTGGQPLMDHGMENLAIIALFSSPGWCGNRFMSTAIGSDFESACNQPITRTTLNDIRNAAIAALTDAAFGSVTVTATNPTGDRLSISILLEPPTSDPVELSLNRSGSQWLLQASNPAYKKVIPEN